MNSGEKSALPMVSSSSSASHKYEGLVSLEDSWMKISVVSQKWLSLKNLGSQPVKGALMATLPISSLGEVHRGSCSGNIQMEEEKVEVKVQEDEVEDGRNK